MIKKKYTGFTLVEMLIVMGILSILMAIGVSVARFAIQRANNIQHQSAADQLFQAFQSHYTDKRHYPPIGAGDGEFDNFSAALDDDTDGVLAKYVDASFDGGAPARFWYIVDSNQSFPQAFLVCVSYSDPDVAVTTGQAQGGYCTGNGFGVVPTDGSTLTDKIYEDDDWVDVMEENGLETESSVNHVTSDWLDGDWDAS